MTIGHHHSRTICKGYSANAYLRLSRELDAVVRNPPYVEGGKTEKMTINLENPKTFLPLMLFFGFIFVLVGMGWESLTSNSTLVNDGWIVVVVAILLWILAKLLESRGY